MPPYLFPSAHRGFLPSRCGALPRAGAASQEQPHLKPSLHTPSCCLHTRYLSLLEPCPSQNPNSEGKGPVPGGTKNCSGSLCGTISKPTWYCSIGMSLGLPQGLWSMHYDLQALFSQAPLPQGDPTVPGFCPRAPGSGAISSVGMDYGPVPHLKGALQ